MSENQKPKDQKKSWVTRLGSKWVQALIATLIGLSITVPLALFWDTATKWARTWEAERQNVSDEDALAEAKENVGTEAVDTIPFRNADSNQQYIAVITEQPMSNAPPVNPYPADSQEGREYYFN